MKNTTKTLIDSCGFLILLGCATAGCSETADTNEGGLRLSEASAQRVGGTLDTAGVRVRLEAHTEGGGRVAFAIDNDGKSFTYRADPVSGEHDLDGHGAVLTAVERQALGAVAVGVAEAIDVETPVSHAVVALSSFWSEAPEGYVHAPRTLFLGGDVANSTSNDGISCVKKNSWYTAWYTDGGGTHSENVQANSTWSSNYSCMGRCGAGCSGFSLYGRWTLDCLEHDACSFRNNSSGGSADANCGDEYNEATDDFINAGWYGCGG